MINVSTPNLPLSASIDELVGNVTLASVKRTRRIAVADLSRQLSVTGAIGSALDTIARLVTATYVRSTYAGLTAISGATVGQYGYVIADTVELNGEYQLTSGGWVRLQALPSDVALAARDAAIAAAAQAAAIADAIADGNIGAVAVSQARWCKALKATSATNLKKVVLSIPPDVDDDIRIAWDSRQPVIAGGVVWTFTKDTLLWTDSQMLALMTAALAVSLF